MTVETRKNIVLSLSPNTSILKLRLQMSNKPFITKIFTGKLLNARDTELTKTSTLSWNTHLRLSFLWNMCCMCSYI